MPWTCPTCKHVFDVGPSVPITPPEAHAEADIDKLKMDAEHLQYERDEAREKLAAMEADVDSLGDLPSSWPTNEAESAALSSKEHSDALKKSDRKMFVCEGCGRECYDEPPSLPHHYTTKMEKCFGKWIEATNAPAPAANTEGLREAFIAGAWWHLMVCPGALTHEKAHDEAKKRYADAALRASPSAMSEK